MSHIKDEQITGKKLIWLAIIIVFVLTVILWIFFVIYTMHTALYEGPVFEYVLKPFLIGMTLLPILGGFFGIMQSKLWGGMRSAIGRSLFFLALGLIGWGLGMVIWNYYLFFTTTEVPYPSFADLFFILIWIFWTYSMLQLSKATGAKYGFRAAGGKTLAILTATIAVLASYYLVFKLARQGVLDLSGTVLTNLLAFLYPLGDVVILITSVLVVSLSYKFLGGKYRIPIFVLFSGFILNYVTDIIFVFTITNGTYFNGHLADFLYVLMLFILCIGISRMDPKLIGNTEKV